MKDFMIPLYLEPCQVIHNNELVDGFSLETKSYIPLRWLWIMKDFHSPATETALIQPKEYPDFHSRIRSMNPLIFRELIQNLSSINGYFKVFSGHEGKNWETSNIYVKDWSAFSKWVMYESNHFYSLGSGYRQLPSQEGGIILDNPFVRLWMNFHHRVRNETGGTHRPYCKGTHCYSTSKDITMEELRIMYMIFEKLGCQLSQFFYG
jgi:hypothetical protein